MNKNFVFSKNPINTAAEEYHNPTPAFIGNTVYKSGNKKGNPTPKYSKYINEHKNKPDFKKENLIGDTVSTINGNKNVNFIKDKRVKKSLKLKKALDVEFSNGILRPKPNSTISFNYNINDNFGDSIYKLLKKKKGKYVIKWDGGNAEINLTGDWRLHDHATIYNAVSVSSEDTYFNIENLYEHLSENKNLVKVKKENLKGLSGRDVIVLSGSKLKKLIGKSINNNTNEYLRKLFKRFKK